jgi:hypothetical protein
VIPQPWERGETPEEEQVRREAHQRLADAARRIGMPLEQLASVLGQLARNQAETRRFLTEEVYGAPDEFLDDLLRLRLKELEQREGEGE